jgi:uncharacterized protein
MTDNENNPINDDNFIEMFIGGLVLDPNTKAPVVILKNLDGNINLPIWIGIPEATAIASAVKQVAVPRPLTHDLMFAFMQQVEMSLEKIVISDLKESTYYAELICIFNGKKTIFDARPSDAINMALRAQAQIFVSRHVLEKAKILMVEQNVPNTTSEEVDNATEETRDFAVIDKERWKEILQDLDPDDFKYRM